MSTVFPFPNTTPRRHQQDNKHAASIHAIKIIISHLKPSLLLSHIYAHIHKQGGLPSVALCSFSAFPFHSFPFLLLIKRERTHFPRRSPVLTAAADMICLHSHTIRLSTCWRQGLPLDWLPVTSVFPTRRHTPALSPVFPTKRHTQAAAP